MSQQLLEVSTLCPHTCMKTATPLVNCFVNNALVHVRQTLLQFVDIVYRRATTDRLQFTKNLFNIIWK